MNCVCGGSIERQSTVKLNVAAFSMTQMKRNGLIEWEVCDIFDSLNNF